MLIFSKTTNCTRPTGSCNFVSLCLFIPNCTRNHVINYTNTKGILILSLFLNRKSSRQSTELLIHDHERVLT